MENIKINIKIADKIISLILLILCCYTIYEIKKFSEYGRYFPYIVTIFLLVFSFIYFFKNWIVPLKSKSETIADEHEEIIQNLPNFAIGFAGVLAYIFIFFNLLGFLIGTILFCVGVPLSIRIVRHEISFKSTIGLFITSSIFSLLVYYVFRRIFHIPLP